MAAKAGGDSDEGILSGGFGHVSADKMEPVEDADMIDSTSKAALGTVRFSIDCLLFMG